MKLAGCKDRSTSTIGDPEDGFTTESTGSKQKAQLQRSPTDQQENKIAWDMLDNIAGDMPDHIAGDTQGQDDEGHMNETEGVGPGCGSILPADIK